MSTRSAALSSTAAASDTRSCEPAARALLAMAGGALLRSALSMEPCATVGHHVAEATPSKRVVQQGFCSNGEHAAKPESSLQWKFMQSNLHSSEAAKGRAWGIETWSTGPRAVGNLDVSMANVRTAFASVASPSSLLVAAAAPEGLELLDMPIELVQTILDWLPTFQDRVRFCRACKACRRLDWRAGPPRALDEEMSGMNLGDRGALAVAQALQSPLIKGLGELSLACNGIGDAGACAVARALRSGVAIRRLSLRDNAIGDAGAAALAEELGRNATLEELDLWGNAISDVGKAMIQRMARCDVFLEVDLVRPLDPSLNTVNTKMRAILFEWIAQVHSGMQMPPAARDEAPDPQDMLFRTYRHVDTYISHHAVQRAELQLAGVACTLLASGYGAEQDLEDDLQLSSWLSLVTDGTCTVEQARSMIGQVKQVLGFRLNQPTVYTFLRRFLRRTGWTEESFSLANYLIELAALDAGFLAYRPQAVAAAAAVLSRQYVSQGVSVKQTPSWKGKLLRCAQVEPATELATCIAAMASLHASKQKDQNNFVNRKYSWETLHSVAKIQPNAPFDASYYLSYMMA